MIVNLQARPPIQMAPLGVKQAQTLLGPKQAQTLLGPKQAQILLGVKQAQTLQGTLWTAPLLRQVGSVSGFD